MINRRSAFSRIAAVVATCVSLTACGLFDDGEQDSVPSTVGGVGKIPGSGIIGSATLPDGMSVNFPALEGKIIGPQVSGNRVLMIGDSVLAGTARRYGGETCAQLVPLGWQVELNAEAGRFIDFALRVVEERIDDDWDAVALLIGTNYGNDEKVFRDFYVRILDRIGDMPVLLLTVSRYKSEIDEANAVIREMAAQYDNVSVLDWSKLSSEPGMLRSDGIHPSDEGRIVLATSLAKALGTAPVTPGECLDSDYTDDSAVLPDVMPSTTTTVPGTAPQSSTSSTTTDAAAPKTTTTTATPQTTTTTTAG